MKEKTNLINCRRGRGGNLSILLIYKFIDTLLYVVLFSDSVESKV